VALDAPAVISVGLSLSIMGFVAWVVVLNAAFRDATWKGVVGFLCGLYLAYWAIVEYAAPNKWLWVPLWLVGAGIASRIALQVGMELCEFLSGFP